MTQCEPWKPGEIVVKVTPKFRLTFGMMWQMRSKEFALFVDAKIDQLTKGE